MNVVIFGAEIVVEVAFLLKRGFCAGEIVEFELRIPLHNVLLEATGHVTVGTPHVVDMKRAIFRLPERIDSGRRARHCVGDPIRCEVVRAIEATARHDSTRKLSGTNRSGVYYNERSGRTGDRTRSAVTLPVGAYKAPAGPSSGILPFRLSAGKGGQKI